MKRHLALLTTVLILACGVFIALKRLPVPDALYPGNTSLAHTAIAPEAPTYSTSANTQPRTAPAPLAARLTEQLTNQLKSTSLSGTTVPATLTINKAGRLVVDSNSKAVMDYFLSLSGEMPDARIRDLMQQWATGNAGEAAADDLLALYDRYQRYRQQFASGEYAATGSGTIRGQLALRQRLRNDTFGADDAAALFADEDRYDRFSLQRHDILASSMDDREKARALSTLRQSLPAHLAQQLEQQTNLQTLQQDEQQLRDAGANDADLFALHQQRFGDAAALRLQALDQQRQDWQQRLDDYHGQRQVIQSSGLSRQDQEQQLAQLRNAMFSETEQQRVAALERIQSASH